MLTGWRSYLAGWAQCLFVALALTTHSHPVRSAEPLEPAQAFRPELRATDDRTMTLRWQIAPGYYLYRHKMAVTALDPAVKLGEIQLPPGTTKQDDFFGPVDIYVNEVTMTIPVLEGTLSGLAFKVSSQGCWDQGICYPPQEHILRLEEDAARAPAAAPVASTGAIGESARWARLMLEGGFWGNLLIFLGVGLLLAFTPCVFPMMPILAGIISQQGHALSRGRTLALSLAYVLGMAITYAAVGIVAGYSGFLLSGFLQSPWVLALFALLMVFLALSMFGFYTLQLPTRLQTRLPIAANRPAGNMPAMALMGALSGLIVGPCVTAPLAAVLLYIAQSGDGVRGGAYLFAMALGMGVPLLVIGMGARVLLPQPGGWMVAVHRACGVLMLAVALWIASPILPDAVVMFGWATLLIIPAIFLHALDPLPPHARYLQRLAKGWGVLMLLVGTLILIGLLGGSRDPLRPLDFVGRGLDGTNPAQPPAHFVAVRSIEEFDQLRRGETKPVLLDFYADWCSVCKEIEQWTFRDPRVKDRLRNFALYRVDLTHNTAEDRRWLTHFGLFGPPGLLFFNREGAELPHLRQIGFIDADAFLPLLTRAQQTVSQRATDRL
jgi:thiol:disulfide interchange protein DsbD